MSIDWNSVQESAGGSYKNFYADGDYTVKCDGVEIKEVGTNGSVIMKFHFEEGKDGQYPTADHWLSFKNDAWRQWHNKCLFNPWVGKILWRRERLPIPGFWPGEFHGLYRPWSCKEWDTTELLSLTRAVRGSQWPG